MNNYFDQAQEREEIARAEALARHKESRQNAAAVSAFSCEECGEEIPEDRRVAVVGCRCCWECQQEIEKHGKTRFAASRS